MGSLVVNPGASIAAPKIYRPPIDSQKGKVHVITGATTGLGLESAKRIASAGATVVMTSRTAPKGEQAVQKVQEYVSLKKIENAEIYCLTLDLDDLSCVKSFPERYARLMGDKPIDVLMNNAGVGNIAAREYTKDGFERTFQSNHLVRSSIALHLGAMSAIPISPTFCEFFHFKGPFLLTSLLFQYLNHTGARIINVSSLAHSFAKELDLNDLNSDNDYSGWGAYAQTKLENILFTQELQRRADAADLNWLIVTSLHPGVVGTDIWRTTSLIGKSSRSRLTSKLFYDGMLTSEEGANTQILLATEKASLLSKGQYYDEFGKVRKVEKFARDPVKAKGLWEASERLLGVQFQLGIV